MNCPACGQPNPEDAVFCGECAASLSAPLSCPQCGQENPPGQKFCHGCAHPLAATSAPSAPETVAPLPAAAARPAPTAPSSVASGRYQLKRFLGEGAKKRVHLARDTRLESDVALALVKTEGLDANGRARVAREAQAMGRLRDHPNVVAVFDIGQENGQPYIVSQYMEGGAVDDLLGKAEGHRLSVERAIDITRDICQGLDHAHRLGIVHRDLKPSNVWLAQDGTARIGDFGLAIALDRSRITQEGVLVGTVAYMPPEQAMGRPPDTRSDLYAVGAMLYEMVTGRTPFLGDDVVAIISQHVNTPPVAPSWHNSKVPSALEALILQLLEKDPQKRPQSAAAVIEALGRVDASSPSTEVPVPALEPRGRAAWGRFVGRREELGQLKQALEDALSGRGSLVMLVGEPGIGKTRTAEEFGVHARLRGAQVLTGRSYEGDVEVPYFPFIEAFRQYVRARPDAELRQELGSGAPEVASLVSEVRERFPDIPQSAALEGEAERLRLFDSVAAFLRNASAATPLVLHLDDLHWADKPSLLLLRYLARSIGSERIVVVGTYRDVELDRNHPLSEVLGELRREPVFRRILLRGLPDEDVMAFLMALADDEPDEETLAARQALAEVLHRETEGNPFFLGEVLSHLVESGKIVWEGGRWQSSVASITDLGIPEGVREVVGRRLSNLSDACNRMLTVASAMPAGFSWESVSAVSEDDEATLLDALDEALASRLIAERKDERTATYEFSHALVRQTLYEELSAPRRVLLHRRIGEALESLFGDNPGPQLAELAHHFFQAAPGGDVHKAIDYAVRAGDRSASSAAYTEAISHYERAVQAFELLATDDPERRCDVLLALAQAHNRSGTSDGARQAAIAAGDLARSMGDAERLALAALSQLSEFVVGLLDIERRVELLEEAHDALGPEDRPSRARLLSRLAVEFSTTENQRSQAFGREAVEVARRLDDPEALAVALNAKHVSLYGAEHLEERLGLSEELGRVAGEAGRSDIEFQAHYNEVFDRLEMGDGDGARRAFEAHESLAQRTREPVGLWQVAVLRCMFVLLKGDFEEAERLAQAALDLAQRFQNDGGMVMYSIQISRVRGEQGRLEEIEAVLHERLELNPHVGWQSRIAQIYAETDRVEECRREFESIAKHDFADINRDIGWLLTMGYLAEVCAYLGDERRAQILYELLLPHANRNIVVLAAAVNGSVSRPLGILATALGRFDAAIAHLQEAQAMNQRMGAPSLTARVQHDHARTLLARGAPGDRETALALANRALQTAQELGMQMLVRRCLTTKLEAQGIDSSETQHSIYAVAAAMQQRPLDFDFSTAPDGTVTLMFSDMVDFTRMTEKLGDERAHEVVQVHNAIVREQLVAYSGFEVELLGDGFLLAFASARNAARCAIAIQQALAAHAAEHPEQPIRVRIGAHTGEALKDADRFFGKTVIQAYRTADQAKPGEIMVSAVTKELVDDGTGGFRFDAGRDAELKGLSGSHRLFALDWS